MRCPSCGHDPAGKTPEVCPACGESLRPAGGLGRIIALTEDIAISLMLCTMVLLVLLQIVLRNFLATGITGGAEIVRHMVLWVAFLGAGLAAREGKHIRIDVAYRILPQGLKRLAEVVTGIFTTTVCTILLYASCQFVAVDYSSGTVIAFHDMPVWILELVIPLGYLAVTLRYARQCMRSFLSLVRGV
jgi:TRAP-type C4-dicarboxylate transport system permease small subunit